MTFDRTRALRLAQETFDIEAAGVLGLKARTGEPSPGPWTPCWTCAGRVVVMGMGKERPRAAARSAATLASTGTPAHVSCTPAEASHGDLGMIKPTDLGAAISNGGESDEITAILPCSSAWACPIGRHDRQPKSSLAPPCRHRAWTAASRRKACPLNLAPTASTTAADWRWATRWPWRCLDARGFKAEDFARSHPGGAPGPQAAHAPERRDAQRRRRAARAAGRELPDPDARDGAPRAWAPLRSSTMAAGCWASSPTATCAA
jgi:arabinose-5-phosphate isomerase